MNHDNILLHPEIRPLVEAMIGYIPDIIEVDVEDDVLVDEMLTYIPLTRRPIKLNLTYRGKGESTLQNDGEI